MSPAPASQPAANQVFESLYSALRHQAHQCLRGERNAQSLSPTLLVHEAYLSLGRSRRIDICDRDHFVRLIARVMRNLLIDHARSRAAAVNGGDLRRVEWTDTAGGAPGDTDRILAVAAAMEVLAARSPDLARLVELRYFAGFSESETASILGVSTRTVRRQWQIARMRLFESISGEPAELSHVTN